MRVAWLLVVVLPLAGCAGTVSGDGDDREAREAPLALQALADGRGCATTTVFFLVEYAQAQQHLPPGFQPRDLNGFLYHTPVTSGQVPAFAAVTHCDSFRITSESEELAGGTLEILYTGFYVEAPWVSFPSATEAVDHDFYLVAFQGPGGETDGLLSAYGWDWSEAVPRLDVDVLGSQQIGAAPDGEVIMGVAAPDRVEAATGGGGLSGDAGTRYAFDATTAYPQAFPAPPKLRFWHDGDSGLGYLQFDLENRTVNAGPVRCWVHPDARVAEVIGRADEDGVRSPEESQCGPDDSFALVFPPHDLSGFVRHMPGVRAG